MNGFNFRLRTMQALLLERGIVVSHETLREWNQKFAAFIALKIQCNVTESRPASPGTLMRCTSWFVVRPCGCGAR
jgi:hypothetical protein